MKRSKIDDPALAGRHAQVLARSGPLAGLPESTLAAFLGQGDLIELAPGEALIREGDPSTPEVYLLIEGALVVQSKGQRIVRLERPGDVVGEAAVVLGSKRSADVLADSAVRAIAIPGAVLAQPEFRDAAAGVRSSMLRDDWIQY